MVCREGEGGYIGVTRGENGTEGMAVLRFEGKAELFAVVGLVMEGSWRRKGRKGAY